MLAATALLLQGCAGTGGTIRTGGAFSAQPTWGEYGCNLNLLRSCYTPPQLPHESNYFIDMWEGEPLRGFALARGLVNNHALFILSHGRAIPTPSGLHYALYPGKRDRGDNTTTCFSIRDIAGILGPVDASQIHNLVLAGCNRENMLYPEEIRACFPNVTNIIHAGPGTDAQMSTFRNALTYPARDIQFLYQMADTFTVGVFDEKKAGKQNPKKAVPYLADLYLPGAKKPFLTQTAGRDLLDPPKSSPGQMSQAAPRANPSRETVR